MESVGWRLLRHCVPRNDEAIRGFLVSVLISQCLKQEPRFTTMTVTDFYLASSEGYGMESPRRCKPIKRLRAENRDDYLLIIIDPPLNGQRFGPGDCDIDQVIVATRHAGQSLFPIR
jgi:hypothetical protein